MTKEKLAALMAKHELGNADIAVITGKTKRQVQSWLSGQYSVPRALSLILMALDERRISATEIGLWVRQDRLATKPKSSKKP